MYRQRIRKMGTVSRPTWILPHSALVLLRFQKCENPVARRGGRKVGDEVQAI
jgi:hypothetical protein